ncbi:cuticle protein 18.6-like [Eriocheir sinensis]|uniref:cuticle protein 18.6-like n=1 Tax=Eriocheir sinensis TaxID=95602 RepID=UPI0021CA0FF4|nr:cuticle protein 18.6-like [Eriocheir sinensis]
MKTSAAALLLVAVAAAAGVSRAAPQNFLGDSDEAETQYQTPLLQYQSPTPRYEVQYEEKPAQYAFQWEVNDDYYGNYYGHQEQREGVLTEGSYYVRLPDTRLMKVDYYVDEFGYHPTITYEGEAQYPQASTNGYVQAPQNTYQQPQPQTYNL